MVNLTQRERTCEFSALGFFILRNNRMKNQKHFPAVFVMLILFVLAFLSPLSARAANPVNWSFYLVTYGSRYEDGLTPTFIDPWYSQYPYEWTLTGVEARLLVNQLWYDLFDETPAGDKSGSGTLGPLPIIDELVKHIDSGWITADILVSVDASGYGTLAIDTITFGQLQGLDVTFVSCQAFPQKNSSGERTFSYQVFPTKTLFAEKIEFLRR